MGATNADIWAGKVFIRAPVIDGWTRYAPELYNDPANEIMALATMLGVGSAGNTPRGGFSSLSERMAATFSKAGRVRRLVASLYNAGQDPGNAADSPVQSGYAGIISGYGVVYNYAQCGETAKITASAGNSLQTINFTATWNTAPKQIFCQCSHQDATAQKALECYVDKNNITTTSFKVRVYQLQNSSVPKVPDTGLEYYIAWLALGGT